MSFYPASGGKTSRIYSTVPYSSPDGGFKCPSDGLYFFRVRSATAGADINVSIKRSGTTYTVTTVKQPSNTNLFAPLVFIQCSENDIVLSTNASSYQLLKLCANTDESTS